MGEHLVPELPSPPELPEPTPPTSRRAWAKVPYEERFRRQRRDLLDAAAALAVGHGVAGTSVASITTAAGLAKRVFYEHFPDKEACFVELFTSYSADRLRTARDVAEANSGRSPVETLHAVIASLVRNPDSGPGLVDAVKAATAPQSRLAAAYDEHHRRIADLLSVVALRLGSELPEATIRLAALILVNGVIGVSAELQERRGAVDELATIACLTFGLPAE